MSSPLIIDLIKLLIRNRVVTGDDVHAMADNLEADGEDEAAQMARLAIIEAEADGPAERRANFVVLPTLRSEPSNGGNDAD